MGASRDYVGWSRGGFRLTTHPSTPPPYSPCPKEAYSTVMTTPPDQQPSCSFLSAPTLQQARSLLGERVRAARQAANLTQQDLAGPDFSKSYISAIERGKMTSSFQALHILAERLGCPISYFLGEEPSKQEAEPPPVSAADEAVSEQVARLREGEQLVRAGRYEEAIALFEQIGQRVRTRWAYEQYAQFLADQGRYQEAYEQMRQAYQG